MQGKATFRGHSLHLMLISFPIGLWTGAFAADVAGMISHDQFWFRMSVALIGMGSVSGILASVCGYVDYLTAPMSRPAKRVATKHFLYSLVMVVAFPVAWLVRAHDHASGIGIALTVLGTLALSVSGYYGSELATRFHVGLMPSTRAGEALSGPAASGGSAPR